MYVWHGGVWDCCGCDTVNTQHSVSLTNAAALKKHVCHGFLKKHRVWWKLLSVFVYVQQSDSLSMYIYTSVMYIET